MKNKYLKITTCVPKVFLGQPLKNAKEIIAMAKKTDGEIVLFPELSLTGYANGDWFLNQGFIEETEQAIKELLKSCYEQIWIVGVPMNYQGRLFNVALVMQNGLILGAVPKMHLACYREFFENRIFSDGREYYCEAKKISKYGQEFYFGELLFTHHECSFGVEICEDLWQNFAPHCDLYHQGAHIVFNLSTSPFQINKKNRRELLCNSASLLGNGAYVYTSTGVTETSSDVIYSGHMIVSELGDELYSYEVFDEEEGFKNLDIDLERINYQRLLTNKSWNLRDVTFQEIPVKFNYEFNHFEREESVFPFAINKLEILNTIRAVSYALYHRLQHIGIKKVCLGVSGGLDSTLALLMINYCFEKYQMDKSGIIAITMPGLATGSASKSNAKELCQALGIDLKEISIKTEVEHHFTLIGKNDDKDVTYENIQARYRTLILMNIANKENALVCGTGDMSEIALGWSTFNGDQMSMYNLNGGLPKTSIRQIVDYFKEIYPVAKDVLQKVIDLPISPELTSSFQLTEDIIGKYEINDFIMYHLFINGASKSRIVFLLEKCFQLENNVATMYYENFMKRFVRNQFKRLTGPESIKIFAFSFSPRSDFHFPGDMKY